MGDERDFGGRSSSQGTGSEALFVTIIYKRVGVCLPSSPEWPSFRQRFVPRFLVIAFLVRYRVPPVPFVTPRETTIGRYRVENRQVQKNFSFLNFRSS